MILAQCPGSIFIRIRKEWPRFQNINVFFYCSGHEKSVTDKLDMNSSTLSVMLRLVCVLSLDTATIYNHIASVIRSQTKSYVYLKGKNFYERRRKVKNGLCKYIFPDIVVAPKSTPGASQIIKIVMDFDVPISVTSDGHSFLCQSTKPGMKWKVKFYNKYR